MEIMHYIHPALGGLAILLGLTALGLGLQSFFSTLRGGPKQFQWVPHVRSGKISLVLLPVIVALGWYVADAIWVDSSFANAHAAQGYAMLVFGMAGLGSGIFITVKSAFKYKWRSKIVRLHGLVNCIAMLCGIYLVFSGVGLFDYLY